MSEKRAAAGGGRRRGMGVGLVYDPEDRARQGPTLRTPTGKSSDAPGTTDERSLGLVRTYPVGGLSHRISQGVPEPVSLTATIPAIGDYITVGLELPRWCADHASICSCSSLIILPAVADRKDVPKSNVLEICVFVSQGEEENYALYAVTQTVGELQKRATLLPGSFSWRGTKIHLRITQRGSSGLPIRAPPGINRLTRATAQQREREAADVTPVTSDDRSTPRGSVHWDLPNPSVMFSTIVVGGEALQPSPLPVAIAGNDKRPVWVSETYPGPIDLPVVPLPGMSNAELLLQAGDVETNPGPLSRSIWARGSALTDPAADTTTGLSESTTSSMLSEQLVDSSQEGAGCDRGSSARPIVESIPANGLNLADDRLLTSDDPPEIDYLVKLAREALTHRAESAPLPARNSYSAVCYILGFPINNGWDVLGDELDAISTEEELALASSADAAEDQTGVTAKKPRGSQKKARRDSADDGGLRPAGPQVVYSSTENQRRSREPAHNRGSGSVTPAAQRDQVVARIVKALRTCRSDCRCQGEIKTDLHAHDDRVLAWVLGRRPKRRFLGYLLCHLWGDDWRDGAPSRGGCDYTLGHLYCMCLEGVFITRDEFVTSALQMGLAGIVPTLRAGLTDPGRTADFYNNLCAGCDLLHQGPPPASSFDEMLQATQNKRMHALNGNPDFPADMKDIDEKTKHGEDYLSAGVPSGCCPPHGGQLISAIQMSSSTQGRVADDTLRDLFHLVADTQTRAGGRVANGDIPYPATCLFPREVRPAGGGPLVNSANWIPVSGMKLTYADTTPLVLTARGDQITTAISENKSQVWRALSVTADGYLNADLEYLSENLRLEGICAEVAAIRVFLLHQILCFRGEPSLIPQAVYQAIDHRTFPLNVGATLSFNDCPEPREQCGGQNTPVFPYLGGTGSISFHVDARSVPFEYRQNIAVAPSWLARHDADECARLLALWVVTLAEWPFCLYTLNEPTASDQLLRNDIANQCYVPSQTTWRVPGLRRLAVVLPREIIDTRPVNYVQAREIAQIRPTSGSRAVGPMPAGFGYQVNCQPLAFIDYPLTEFLASWSTDWSMLDIAAMICGYQSMGLFRWELESAWEMVRAYTSWFPSLISSNPQSTTDFPVDHRSAMAVSLPAHYQLRPAGVGAAPPLPGGWPQANAPPITAYGYEMSVQQLNMITLGLAVAPNPIVPYSHRVMRESLNNCAAIAHQLLGAGLDASAYQILLGMAGFSTQTLRASVDVGGETDAVLDFVEQLFAVERARGEGIAPALFGAVLEKVYAHSSGYCHVGLKIGSTSSSVVTPFDRLGRHADFSLSYDAVGVAHTGMPPALLVTAWLAQFSQDLPKGQCPFSRTWGDQGIQGYSPAGGGVDLRCDRAIVAGQQSNSGFLDQEDFHRYFSTDSSPGLNQDSDYNAKLAMSFWGNRQFLGVGGGVLPPAAGLFLPPNTMLKQRPYPLLPGNNRPGQDADAVVGSVPKLSTHGIRVLVYVTGAAQCEALLKAENRQTTLARATLALCKARMRMATYARDGRPSVWKAGGKVVPDFRDGASEKSSTLPPGATTPTAVVQSTQSAAVADLH